MKMWIPVSMLLLASAASYGQAVPTAEASTGSGPGLSWIDGTVHYSLGVSQLIQDGLYGAGNVTGATNLSGSAGYASMSKDKPFSMLYAGGVLFNTGSGQGTQTYQNIAASQGLIRGKWIFNISNSFSFLPQSPTTGYSGISGVGDLGTTPISGPSQGPAGGVLTFAANRISNTLSGSIERRLTGSTSVSGSGSWSILHFLDQQDGLNTTQISGQVGLNHRIGEKIGRHSRSVPHRVDAGVVCRECLQIQSSLIDGPRVAASVLPVDVGHGGKSQHGEDGGGDCALSVEQIQHRTPRGKKDEGDAQRRSKDIQIPGPEAPIAAAGENSNV